MLLVLENMLRPVPKFSLSILLRLAFELGHSAIQLFDRLRLEESRLVRTEAGVCGEEGRRFVKRGRSISPLPLARVLLT